MDAKEFRDSFPVLKGMVHLCTAAGSPLSTTVRDALTDFMDMEVREPVRVHAHGQGEYESCRKNFARLVGCAPEEVALKLSTTDCMATAVDAIPFKKGDNAIVMDLEYPSVIYPVRTRELRGEIKVKKLKNVDGRVTPGMLDAAIDKRTRAVALSHVSFMNGFKLDVHEMGKICEERDVYFIVDAAQSLGTMPVDVKGMKADFLAAPSFKWLVGVAGISGLYVNRDIVGELRAPYFGTNAVQGGTINTSAREDRFDYPGALKSGALRFEQGISHYMLAAGMNAGLEMILDAGVENIQRHVRHLTDILLEGREGDTVTPPEPKARSAIVKFKCSDLDGNKAYLRKHGVFAVYNEGVRASPHFYNNESDIEQFLARHYEHAKGARA